MPGEQDGEADRLEALRRDLYRSGASDGDVDRYLAQRSAVVEEPEAPVPRDPGPRRRLLLLAAGAVAAAAFGTTAVVRSASPSADPTTSASPAATTGPDEVLTPYGATVPLPTPAAVIAEGEAAAGQRYRGSGDALFPVDAADAPQRAGRVVVRLVAVDGEPLRWRLLTVDPASTPATRLFASGPAPHEGGEPITAVLPYRSGPPALVEVAAPAGARWIADVAFLPAQATSLR